MSQFTTVVILGAIVGALVGALGGAMKKGQRSGAMQPATDQNSAPTSGRPASAPVNRGLVLVHIVTLLAVLNLLGFAIIKLTGPLSLFTIALLGTALLIVGYFIIGLLVKRSSRRNHLGYVALGATVGSVVVNAAVRGAVPSLDAIVHGLIFALFQNFLALGIGRGLLFLVSRKGAEQGLPPADTGSSMPPPSYPMAPGYPPPPMNPYPHYTPPAPQPGTQEPPLPYGAPQQLPSYPPSGYPPDAPGPYGGYTPPSGYGQPEGYSQPMWPGGYPPAAPIAPASYRLAQPPQKSRTGLIIGLVVGAVELVIFGACMLALDLPALATNPNSPVTVSGSTSVTATATDTATTVPSSTPTPTVIYQEPFTSGADGWPNDVGHCYWKDGAYHAAAGSECLAPIGDQTSFDLTVDVRQLSGNTYVLYGLVFAHNSSFYYEFSADGHGDWVLFSCDANSCGALVESHSIAFRGGLNATNKLEVKVAGTNFQFLINGSWESSFNDAKYTSGKVGIFTGNLSESAFNNFLVTRPG
jgi:hypothetical protein